jgi:hypothetical protein
MRREAQCCRLAGQSTADDQDVELAQKGFPLGFSRPNIARARRVDWLQMVTIKGK